MATSSPRLRLNNELFRDSLVSKLQEFVETSELADVTLSCQGEFLQAHKLVLAASSPHLRAMFAATPCKHPIIVLQDTKLLDLRALLQFMYTGVAVVTQEQLPSLLKTAQALGVHDLSRSYHKTDSSTSQLDQEEAPPDEAWLPAHACHPGTAQGQCSPLSMPPSFAPTFQQPPQNLPGSDQDCGQYSLEGELYQPPTQEEPEDHKPPELKQEEVDISDDEAVGGDPELQPQQSEVFGAPPAVSECPSVRSQPAGQKRQPRSPGGGQMAAPNTLTQGEWYQPPTQEEPEVHKPPELMQEGFVIPDDEAVGGDPELQPQQSDVFGAPPAVSECSGVRSQPAGQKRQPRSPGGGQMAAPNTRTKDYVMITSSASHEYKCSTCGKAYTNVRSRNQHVQFIHGKDSAPCICEICHKIFKNRNSMVMHRNRSHTGKDVGKLHKCRLCGKVYGQKINLARHELNIHGELPVPYECLVCHKMFKNEYCLKVHRMCVHRKL